MDNLPSIHMSHFKQINCRTTHLKDKSLFLDKVSQVKTGTKTHTQAFTEDKTVVNST